jgi:hypothetical protein
MIQAIIQPPDFLVEADVPEEQPVHYSLFITLWHKTQACTRQRRSAIDLENKCDRFTA